VEGLSYALYALERRLAVTNIGGLYISRITEQIQKIILSILRKDIRKDTKFGDSIYDDSDTRCISARSINPPSLG